MCEISAISASDISWCMDASESVRTSKKFSKYMPMLHPVKFPQQSIYNGSFCDISSPSPPHISEPKCHSSATWLWKFQFHEVPASVRLRDTKPTKLPSPRNKLNHPYLPSSSLSSLHLQRALLLEGKKKSFRTERKINFSP